MPIDITSRLEALKADASRSSTDALILDVAKLRKELIDATSYLPAYDQRQYELVRTVHTGSHDC